MLPTAANYPEDDEQNAGDYVHRVRVCLVEEGLELTCENEGHDDGHDEHNAYFIEYVEELGVLTAVYLIEHIIGLELPAYHQRHEHCAERHCNTLRPAVHEVEEAVVPCLIAPELEHARFAQTVNRDENSLNEDKSGDPKGNPGALRRLASFYALVDEVGSHNLHQGDCGGDGGEDNEQIEDDAEQRTGGTHVVENVLQGDEQETGAAEGYLGIGSAGLRYRLQRLRG